MSKSISFYDKARESFEDSSARSFYLMLFYAFMKNFFWGYLELEIDLLSIIMIFSIVFGFSFFLKLLESEKEEKKAGYY